MSLLPYVFRDMIRPLRMLENQVRLAEEMFHPFATPIVVRNQRRPGVELEIDQNDTIIQDKEKFQVKLNVRNFAPQEITVKTLDSNCVQIEGKHEEHEDGKGYISRQFIRKFVLPEGHDLKEVVSSLSSDGTLTVTAPRKAKPEEEEKIIPVVHQTSENEK